MNDDSLLVLGAILGAISIPLIALGARMVHVTVHEGEAVLVRRFGKLVKQLRTPGWHLVPDRFLPWVRLDHVSMRRDHREIKSIVLNDARGTTVVVDVFLEMRVEDPYRALFAVEDWERALGNVVSHAVISILGMRELKEILSDRTELRQLLEREIAEETARWGVRIERVFLRDVRLHPELEHNILRSVAAKLERWKADIEEEGSQRAAKLAATTGAELATLTAEAKTQHLLAVGRAYSSLERWPIARKAYDELYELSLLHPNRTVAFVGFGDGEVKTIEAAMIPVLSQ